MSTRTTPSLAATAPRSTPFLGRRGRWATASVIALFLGLSAAACAEARIASAGTGSGPDLVLSVDASDTARKIYWVKETILSPAPGPMVLRYPQWEAASHGPTISVAALAGLEITADGKAIPWRRDRIDAHAFHIEAPVGVETLSIAFQIITSANEGLLGRDFVSVPWQRLLLYPAGRAARDISVATSVTLPADLQPASSLSLQRSGSGAFLSAPVPLDTLMDSPIQAAPVVETLKIGRIAGAPVNLNLLAGSREQVA